eukprot:gene11246-23175_t
MSPEGRILEVWLRLRDHGSYSPKAVRVELKGQDGEWRVVEDNVLKWVFLCSGQRVAGARAVRVHVKANYDGGQNTKVTGILVAAAGQGFDSRYLKVNKL